MSVGGTSAGALAFSLIYFTFFLDNVLLTVLVPIIPDWVRGESLAFWVDHNAPLAQILNTTVHASRDESKGLEGSQATVGLVLGAKAAAQILSAPLAASAVMRHGAAPVLRLATVILAGAAIVFTACSGGSNGPSAAVCACVGRIAHGTGAALAGVAGLALVTVAVPAHQRDRAIGALLGAVALGVLVGYPFGGISNELWSRGAPFLIIAIALFANLVMQYMFLCREEYSKPSTSRVPQSWKSSWSALRIAQEESVGACAGAVLLATSVMAALEPCLPLWIMEKFHPQRWQTGAVFIPDSAGYLAAATCLGGVTRAIGAERVAIAGQLAVGFAALAVPHARSVSGLAFPHICLGCGLGAGDAALVPALLARYPRRVPQLAALLHSASSAAYALGPILGGLMSWSVGFETAMRTLGVLNLLYAGLLYQALSNYPLSEQWGATTPEEDSDSVDGDGGELTPLKPQIYSSLQ